LEVNTIHQKGSIEIKGAKYGKVEPKFVTAQQKYLSAQQQGLAKLLHKFSKLFSGKLGRYPYKRVHLELQPNDKPV